MSVTAMSGPLRAVIDYLACVDDAGSLADQLAAQTSWLAPPRQQELLEILDAGQRLERLDVLTCGPAPAAPAAAASPA